MTDVVCPYCSAGAELVTGEVIYPYREDLHGKNFYLCRPCKAWAGCHPGTDEPLGSLADAELRKWRARAHEAFDPLWKRKMELERLSKSKARGLGYAWLARQLGRGADDCHIGGFDIDTCKRVIELCTRRASKAAANPELAPQLSLGPEPKTPAIDELGPRPGNVSAPLIPLLKVRSYGDKDSYGYIYRAKENPRLGRMDHYTRQPRSMTSTWFVDYEKVGSLAEALSKLGDPSAPAGDA